eukprot:jgi/Chlat1/2190/Chrsp17S08747
MFSSGTRLKERTGRHGTPRIDYLQATQLKLLLTAVIVLHLAQALVLEFQSAQSEDIKVRIAANLANFAYDPINYGFIRQLHIIDLFLDCLTEPSPHLVEFGIAGLCNCAADPNNAEVIVAGGGVEDVLTCLASKHPHTVQAAITTLYYLLSPQTQPSILTPATLATLRVLCDRHSPESDSKPVDPVTANLAGALLSRHCGES